MEAIKSNTFARVQDRVTKLVSDGFAATQFLEQVSFSKSNREVFYFKREKL